MKTFSFYFLTIFLLLINSSCFKEDVEDLENESLLLQIENETMVTLDSYILEDHPTNSNLKRAIISIDCVCFSFSNSKFNHFISVSNRIYFQSSNEEIYSISLLYTNTFVTEFTNSNSILNFKSSFINPVSGKSEGLGDFKIQF